MQGFSIPYLVLPPLLPVLLALLMWLGDVLQFPWLQHKQILFWLPASIFVSLLLAFVFELYWVPKSLWMMWTHAELRSLGNALALLCASLYLLVCMYFGYFANR